MFFNKIDLLTKQQVEQMLENFSTLETEQKVYTISNFAGRGLDLLKKDIIDFLQNKSFTPINADTLSQVHSLLDQDRKKQ